MLFDGRARRGDDEPVQEGGGGAQQDRRDVGGPQSEAERGRDDQARTRRPVVNQAVGDRLLMEVVPTVLGVYDAFR